MSESMSNLRSRVYSSLILSPLVLLANGFWGSPPPSLAQDIPLAQLQPQQQRQQQRRQRLREGNEHLVNQDYEAAEAIFRELIEDYPQDSLLRYKLGDVLSAQYRYEEASQAYQEAIRLNEDHALAYNALGNLRANQGRLDEAVSLYERALEINDRYVEAMQNLGRVLAELERFAAASQVLSQALEIAVERDELWKALEVAKLLEQVNARRGLV
ncbi:MAG: tetratricopeptide repeat protein [Phormidium sp.]